MNRDRGWLVCDMDQGVLRCEPTRRAALAWAMAPGRAQQGVRP